MKSYLTGMRMCPCCGHCMDAAASVGVDVSGMGRERAPKAGDISLCSNCLEVLIFETDSIMRKAEEKDFTDSSVELVRSIVMVRKALVAAQEKFGKPMDREEGAKNFN